MVLGLFLLCLEVIPSGLWLACSGDQKQMLHVEKLCDFLFFSPQHKHLQKSGSVCVMYSLPELFSLQFRASRTKIYVLSEPVAQKVNIMLPAVVAFVEHSTKS